jgi:hypothetical protein
MPKETQSYAMTMAIKNRALADNHIQTALGQIATGAMLEMFNAGYARALADMNNADDDGNAVVEISDEEAKP